MIIAIIIIIHICIVVRDHMRGLNYKPMNIPPGPNGGNIPWTCADSLHLYRNRAKLDEYNSNPVAAGKV